VTGKPAEHRSLLIGGVAALAAHAKRAPILTEGARTWCMEAYSSA
jgi:hypothetical protein